MKEQDSERNNLPEGWMWTTVGQISKSIQYGYTASATSESCGTRFLRITDIQENFVDWESVPYCKIEEPQKHKFLLNQGDLVFARTGATVGKSFLIRGNIPESVFASYLIRICLDPNVDASFVSNFFQSHLYWKQIHEEKAGIGQPNVNATKLGHIAIPLPPFPEQCRIVSKIEELFTKLDAGVDELKKAKAQLRRYRRSVLESAMRGELTRQWRDEHKGKIEPAKELLTRILEDRKKQWGAHQIAQQSSVGSKRRDQELTLNYEQPNTPTTELKVPEGWSVARTDQVFFYVTSGSRNWAKYYSDSGAIFVRIGNLDHYDIDLDLSSAQHVLPIDGAEGARTRLHQNDILISITADVGMIGLVPLDLEEAYINQHIALARPVQSIQPKFLAWLLASDFGQRQLRSLQRGATKAGLGLDDIRAIDFGLPSVEEQVEIVGEIERHFSIIHDIDSALQNGFKQSNRLHQSILSDAFGGKLVPQDPTDEPAEKLFERIRENASKSLWSKRKRKSSGDTPNGE
ncbi:MAG: restriction endonuclease subunit S [Syntrophobacteraceae bacterium]